MEPSPHLVDDALRGVEDRGRSGGSEDAPLSLSPKVVLFWRVPWVIGTLVLVGIAAAIAAASNATGVWTGIAIVLLLIGVAGGVLLPPAQYRRWRYWVTDDGIELRHGLVFRSESSIPHFRVQHIDVRQGPLQRWAGVTELVISTASAATDATLPGVEPERAATIRQVVLARAEADDAV